MSEDEGTLVQLGSLLSKVARPHRCDDRLPDDVQARLWELGVPCGDETSREELITRLWARKRSLLLTMQLEWGGPGVTPPTAA
jgi:hypothetical protein